MPSILLFYNKLVDISLPKTIDEIFLNKTIINNYNYFKENPNELVNIQSMCFSISDVVFLYKIIKNNLEFFVSIRLDLYFLVLNDISQKDFGKYLLYF